jgi:hypothetical protein
METTVKTMKTIETYIKNVYQQLLMHYKDPQRGNIAGKHQAHLASQIIKDTWDYIMNTSSDKLASFQNNQMSITSTLPNSNIRPEWQLELVFGLGETLFSLYNYINHNTDNSQITKNTNSSFTHISEIQEDHLKHLDIEVATISIYICNL